MYLYLRVEIALWLALMAAQLSIDFASWVFGSPTSSCCLWFVDLGLVEWNRGIDGSIEPGRRVE